MFQPKTETSSDRLTRQHQNRTAVVALLCAGRPAEKSNTHSSSALKFSLIDLSCYFITLLPSAAGSSLSPVGGILRGIPKRSNPCVCPYGISSDSATITTNVWIPRFDGIPNLRYCVAHCYATTCPRVHVRLSWCGVIMHTQNHPTHLSNQHSFCR